MKVCEKCGNIIDADYTESEKQDIRIRTDMDVGCVCNEESKERAVGTATKNGGTREAAKTASQQSKKGK